MTATDSPNSEAGNIAITEPKTQWIGLAISSLLSFFCGIQITLYYSTMWPFLLQLDPATTETFYGFTNAAHSLAQAIMALSFGFLINKLEKSRLVIILGFSSMAVANCLYLLCSIQLFPSVLMVFMRIFLGTGAATYTILRTYTVQVSTCTDRSRAISMGLAAFSLGLSIGHSVQAMFASVGYPGKKLIWGFYLTPAFAGLLCNVIVILIAALVFREADIPDGVDSKIQKKTDNETVSLPPYDKIAVAVCIFTQFVCTIMITTSETILAYVMTMFNWTKKDAQYYNAIRLAASGYIALGIYCLDFVCGLWKRLNQRIGAISGLLFFFAFNLLTFSWWWLPGTLTYQEEFIVVNGSQVLNPEPIGCRRSFEWCKDVPPVNVWLFNISYPLLCGTGIALVNANMNTVFSKIIGPRKQGTLMGLLVDIGCLAKTIGPLSLSALFCYYGPRPVWAIGIIFSGGCAALWTAFYHRLQPLKTPLQKGLMVPIPPYDKVGVAICVFTQFVYMVMVTTMETVHAPYGLTMFNWTKKEAQYYGALRLAASGYIALGIYCVDLIFGLWNRLNQRICALTGLLFFFAFNVLTFSWWWLPGSLTYQVEVLVVNGSQVLNPEPVGCRISFEWCPDVTPINVDLFNISFAVLCEAGLAFINANLNSVFSKIIGPRKQGTLMGLFIGIGCMAKTFGTVSLSALFRYYGPRPVWTIGMAFTGGCAALWAGFYRRLQPLMTE